VRRFWANGINGALYMTVLSSQGFQQYLSVLKVSGVKALGKPAIAWCQQLAGGGVLALALPQPTQTDGSSEFQRLRLLAMSDVESLAKTVCCVLLVRDGLPQQQLPSDAIQLWFL
jgi:hypothetical protein